MNRFEVFRRWAWSILVVSAMAFALGGCSGDDGRDGADGQQGPPGQQGPEGPPGPGASVIPLESCGVCHDQGSFADAAAGHALDPIETVSNVTFAVAGADLDVTFDVGGADDFDRLAPCAGVRGNRSETKRPGFPEPLRSGADRLPSRTPRESRRKRHFSLGDLPRPRTRTSPCRGPAALPEDIWNAIVSSSTYS